MKIIIETENEREGQRLVGADETMLLVSAIADKMGDSLKYEGKYTLDDAYMDLHTISEEYWRD